MQEKEFNLEFKYSFFVDLRIALQTLRELSWLKKNNLAYVMPSFRTMWQLYRHQPIGLPIKTEIPTTCYWVSSGTWGSYELPNRIYICPWYIERGGGMERVIRHELLHLDCHERTLNMDYDSKEAVVEKIEYKK